MTVRDTENHHGYGVHDADEDLGKPGGRIGEVSPVIGKVPANARSLTLTTGRGCSAWGVRRTGAVCDLQLPGGVSLSVEADHVARVRADTRICRK
jgi:hypothetical protein